MENIETIIEQLSSLLGIDFVQDVDNTFLGIKQINKFKLEIILSQTDTDYIDIASKLIGKENTFSCNTFARSKYHDVFISLNDITHKAKVLVNSIENFTKYGSLQNVREKSIRECSKDFKIVRQKNCWPYVFCPHW